MKLIKTCLVFLLVLSMPALTEEKKSSKWGIGLNTGCYIGYSGRAAGILSFNIQHQISSRFAFQVEIESIHRANNFIALMYFKGLLFLTPKNQDKKKINFNLFMGIGKFLYFSDSFGFFHPVGFIKYGGGLTYRINSHMFTNFDLYLANGWMYFPYMILRNSVFLSLNLGLKYRF